MKKKLTRQEAAKKAGISLQLYSWLELDDTIITHPHFAWNIMELFKLTIAQHNTMVAPKHYLHYERRKRGEVKQNKSGV